MPGAFEAMLPYLSIVNLNGMTKDGPKILPIGSLGAMATRNWLGSLP